MAYELALSKKVTDAIVRLGKSDRKKLKKVHKALAQLSEDPRYPGLQSKVYVGHVGPGGAKLWESYIEQGTPGAWRVWWSYGPGPDRISVEDVGPHP